MMMALTALSVIAIIIAALALAFALNPGRVARPAPTPPPGPVRRPERSGWEDLIGSFVLVNDTAGDGYVGILASVTARVVRLEESSDRHLTFRDGQTKEAVTMERFVNIPADKVKFITGVS